MPLWFLLAALTAFAPVQAAVTVRDLDGRLSTPLAPAGGDIHVIFFVNAECPISGRYAPEIDRITADYATRGVRSWLVYADATLSPAAARTNLKEFHPRLTVPVVIDSSFALTAAVGATVTPEVAIYTKAGRVYRGRIDDSYVSIGQNRREAIRKDLRASLDAILAGKPVPQAETLAVGCFIERSVK